MVILFPSSYQDGANRTGNGREAAAISVEMALSSASDIDSSEISVSSLGAYVVLGGFVRSELDLQRAEDIAADIVGSDYVRSRLLRR